MDEVKVFTFNENYIYIYINYISWVMFHLAILNMFMEHQSTLSFIIAPNGFLFIK